VSEGSGRPLPGGHAENGNVMNISELLIPERIACCPQIGSKKRLLETISELLARKVPQLGKNEIFNSLISREKLGTTGLGRGVAIPHGRLGGLQRPVCAFIKLEQPIEFDALDGQPVDLVFALIVPEDSSDDHLQILSAIAALFSSPAFCSRLRECGDDACLFQLLTQRDAQQKTA
jgi:PTS system nitrogen regulatory IIA component